MGLKIFVKIANSNYLQYQYLLIDWFWWISVDIGLILISILVMLFLIHCYLYFDWCLLLNLTMWLINVSNTIDRYWASIDWYWWFALIDHWIVWLLLVLRYWCFYNSPLLWFLEYLYCLLTFVVCSFIHWLVQLKI